MLFWLLTSTLYLSSIILMRTSFTLSANDTFTKIVRLSWMLGISLICICIVAARVGATSWWLTATALLSYIGYAVYGWRAIIAEEWRDVKQHFTHTKKS